MIKHEHIIIIIIISIQLNTSFYTLSISRHISIQFNITKTCSYREGGEWRFGHNS